MMSFVPKVSLDIETGRGHLNTGQASLGGEVIFLHLTQGGSLLQTVC